ncbi:MAG: hypothetical protein V2J26_09260 [Pacificimonas sp.]|nr:hypothetical protein [Pacificimonas sp.]
MMKARRGMTALLFAASLGLSACGGDGDEAGSGGVPAGGVNRELAEEGLDFDSSTMDAMSVDVVAGGIPPAADPDTADAAIDMLGNNQPAAEAGAQAEQ